MEESIIRQLSYPVEHLLTLILLWGVACVGAIQFIKEISFFNKTPKRLLAMLVILGVVVLNTRLVPQWLTDVSLIFLLLVSIVKFGYDAFVEGIPKLISGRLASLGGSQSGEPKK